MQVNMVIIESMIYLKWNADFFFKLDFPIVPVAGPDLCCPCPPKIPQCSMHLFALRVKELTLECCASAVMLMR